MTRPSAPLIARCDFLQVETRSRSFQKEMLYKVPVNDDVSDLAACRDGDVARAPPPAGRAAHGHFALTSALAIGYEAWGPVYDADMVRYGYRLPSRMTDEARRHIEDRRALLLDVGAGSGLLGQALRAGGYDNLVGLEPSRAMLRLAQAKRVYRRLLPMALGPAVEEVGYRFDAALAAGVFKAGHAPPEALEDLVRLVRPGGIVIFDLNTGSGAAAYDHCARRLANGRKWRHLRSTAPFSPLPGAAPESTTIIHVFQTIGACRREGQPRFN